MFYSTLVIDDHQDGANDRRFFALPFQRSGVCSDAPPAICVGMMCVCKKKPGRFSGSGVASGDKSSVHVN
jgi:hypothetical protein